MSRDLGWDVPDLEKLYAKELWADFSYPKFRNHVEMHGMNSRVGPKKAPRRNARLKIGHARLVVDAW